MHNEFVIQKIVAQALRSKEVGIPRASTVAHAIRAFPKPVFTAWMRHRRHSADKLMSGWREVACCHTRVAALDVAAEAAARFN